MINWTEIDHYIKSKRYANINSIGLYRDDEVSFRYYNGYDHSSRNVIRSIAKSIVSICVGICLDQGIIKDIKDPIGRYLPPFALNSDPYHRMITIEHLITMTSGIYWNGGVHYHCPMMDEMKRSKDWIMHITDVTVKDIPGSKYNYKEWDMILLTTLVERATGEDISDFIYRNIYQPLGIQEARWWKSPCGVTYGVGDGTKESEEGSGLTAMELMAIGKLFLKGGIHEGKQIVSKDYIMKATSSSKANQGYGYLWWIGDGWYGCRGYGGQNITVFPEKNTVFVMQATPTSRGMSYDDVMWEVMGQL